MRVGRPEVQPLRGSVLHGKLGRISTTSDITNGDVHQLGGRAAPMLIGIKPGKRRQNMPAPTTSWFCDSCVLLIEQPDHGWVEWIDIRNPEGGFGPGHGIRIVHRHGRGPFATRSVFSNLPPSGCQYGSNPTSVYYRGVIGDDELTMFQGPDGLMQLLELIATQRLPTLEVLEIIKRIHIPGYEHARQHMDRALAAGVIQTNVFNDCWRQAELQAVLDFAAEQGGCDSIALR